MEKNTDLNRSSFFGRQLYIYMALLLAIPLFVVLETLLKAMHVDEDELVAAAATACVLLAVFAGRYVVQLWGPTLKELPAAWMVALSGLLIASVCWIFFHADFPLTQRPALNVFLLWLPLVLAGMVTGMLVRLIRLVAENKIRSAEMDAMQSRTELQALQSQLSPHFLFNTLNNLYGLSLNQPDKLPQLLLKLAELLRYGVYDAAATFVPLRDEMAYLENYIAFEKIRLGDRLRLDARLPATGDDHILIAPMLLIVFVENAFKHSRNTNDPQVDIEMELTTWGKKILFFIKNSCRNFPEGENVVTRHSGFGLANVQKRLDMLYPGEYDLQVEKGEGHYTVHLTLAIK
ncbi:sensor histidine kinase [Flavihumibacter petaseus]|uniref:Putative two-component histidine kinase n=1 Tax=Flavihumibacter petaseus NBRC 106054 TaxID=1220578 RepID=A0A0E9N5G9_9BACT|nr:histidine kinase [Flavihumibacter petaseus]GAO44926.1 putative two-component histidine kinase [Flavihumibacter petaseus NBRC 106054]